MIAFREAARDDVAAIAALLADDVLGAERETPDLAPYFAAFDAMAEEPHNLLLVGELQGEIAACYQLSFLSGLSLAATRRAQIEAVRVARQHRGAGYGAALLADAEKRARAAGCALLQLTSNQTRTRAVEFYKAQGFVASHVGLKKPLR